MSIYTSILKNMRTLEEIQLQIANRLIQEGSPATDLSQGSVLSTLIRSLAVPHLVSSNLLNDLSQRLNLQTARGSDLDTLASNLGVFRKGSTRSRGSLLVLAIDTSGYVLPGDDFTDLTTGQQYVADIEQRVEIKVGVESPITVVSTVAGSGSNLKAGTRLTATANSSNTLNLQATVGLSRLSSGKYCGDLSGGLDRESDLTFRQRVAAVLRTKDSNSLDSIKERALGIESVHSVWVYTKSPGTVEVLVQGVSPLSNEQLSAIRNLLIPLVAAGIFMMVTQVRPNLIDVTIEATPRGNEDLTELQLLIKSSVLNYFNNLEANRQPTASSLATRLKPLLKDVYVEFPNSTQQIGLTYDHLNSQYVDAPILTYGLGVFKVYFQ